MAGRFAYRSDRGVGSRRFGRTGQRGAVFLDKTGKPVRQQNQYLNDFRNRGLDTAFRKP